MLSCYPRPFIMDISIYKLFNIVLIRETCAPYVATVRMLLQKKVQILAVIFISFVVKFCFNWSKSTISCWLQTLVGSVQFIYKWGTNNITLMQDYMHWKLNVLIFQITKINSSAILLKNEFETLLLPTCTPFWLLTLPTWRTTISIVLESQDIPLVF